MANKNGYVSTAALRDDEQKKRALAAVQAQISADIKNGVSPAATMVKTLVLPKAQPAQKGKPAPMAGRGRTVNAPVSRYASGGPTAAPAATYAAGQGLALTRPARVQTPRTAQVSLPFLPQGPLPLDKRFHATGSEFMTAPKPAQQMHMLFAGVQGLTLDEYERQQNAANALSRYNEAHTPRNVREVAFGRVTDAEADAARAVLIDLYSRPYEVWTQNERAEQQRASGVFRTYVKNQQALGQRVNPLDTQLADMSGRFGNAARSIYNETVAALPVLVETAQQQADNTAQSRKNPAYGTLENEIAALNDYLRAAAANSPEDYYVNGGMTGEQWKRYQQTGTLPTGIPLTVHEYDTKRKRLQEAEAQRREMAVTTPVSPDAWGARKMNLAAQQRENALMGLSGAERFLGGTAIGLADNTLTLPLAAVNPALPLAAMGTKAAAQKTNELNGRGFAPGEAALRGMLAGGTEVLTEKMPVETMWNIVKTGGKGYIKNILTQMGVEATEEAASTVLNHAADVMANDPEAKLSWQDVALSAFGGMLSAAGGAAIGTALHHGAHRVNELLPGFIEKAATVKDKIKASLEEPAYDVDPAAVKTSWKERTYMEDGKMYLQSEDQQRLYEVPLQAEIEYTVNDEGRVLMGIPVMERVDPQDFRDFIKAFAELNLNTKYALDTITVTEAKPVTVKATNEQIIITQKGINEFMKKIRGAGIKTKDNAESALLLNKIIENMKVKDNKGNTKGRVNPYTYYTSAFSVDGRHYSVTLDIKNVPEGARYYYHTLNKIKIEQD